MATVRKKRRRRRNKGRFSFILKILTIAAVFAAMTMGATVFFQLEQVVVTGNHRYTAQEIEKISGLLQGDNLFRMNKYEIEQDILQALPYVEDVTITRRLPSTIQIAVKEWDAVARIPASGYSNEEWKDEEIPESDEEPEDEKAPEAAEEPDSGETPETAGESEPDNGETPEAAGEHPEDEGTEEPAVSGEGGEPEEDGETGKSEQSTAGDEVPGNLWLMSVGGRLLEPATENSPGILIKGLTALSPKAGTQLAVSQTQQDKLNALLDLMAALEARGCIEEVSEIDLSAAAEIYLRYDDRFLVKLPMAGDFEYCLHALEKVVEQRAANETGTMDLTRKDYAVVYSPE